MLEAIEERAFFVLIKQAHHIRRLRELQQQVARDVVAQARTVLLLERLDRARAQHAAHRGGEFVDKLGHLVVARHRRAVAHRVGPQTVADLWVLLQRRTDARAQCIQQWARAAALAEETFLSDVRREAGLARFGQGDAREADELAPDLLRQRRAPAAQAVGVIVRADRRELVRQQRRVPPHAASAAALTLHHKAEELGRARRARFGALQAGECPADVHQTVVVRPGGDALLPDPRPQRLELVLVDQPVDAGGRERVQEPLDAGLVLDGVGAVERFEALEQQRRALDVPPSQAAVL